MTKRAGSPACFLLALALGASLFSSRVAAGGAPEIASVVEARDPESDHPVLVVSGRGLRGVRGGMLTLPAGDPVGPVGVISPGSTTVALSLPVDVPPGNYRLVLSFGSRKSPVDAEPFPLSIAADGVLLESVGVDALHPDLREDLDDAESMGGESIDFYRDAEHFDAGTLPVSVYSAMDDLEAEGAVADGELTTGLYSAIADLLDEGVVGGDGLLDTSRYSALKDLASEGILDGSGDLHPDHYSAWADLEDEGYLVGGELPPSLYSAWASLADSGHVSAGVLGAAYFDAWTDLEDEDRIGTNNDQVAAGDHDHDDSYVLLTGDSVMDGPLTVNLSDTHDPITQPLLWAESSRSGSAAIWLEPRQVRYQTQVSGTAYGDPGCVGVFGHHSASTGSGYGVLAQYLYPDRGYTCISASMGGARCATGLRGVAASPDGYGIYVTSKGTGLHLSDAEHPNDVDQGRARTILRAIHSGDSGDIALFQAGTSTVARIDRDGKGWFNGGVQTSGADFAERVDAGTDAEILEPGDVLIIDVEGARRFRRSDAPESSLVAGVVSGNPGVVGQPRPVSATGPANSGSEVVMGIVGIVPVKVTDEGGAIAPGDLLVTSSTPGHAMKAPRSVKPLTVLGKALGTLVHGKGQVECLLRLK